MKIGRTRCVKLNSKFYHEFLSIKSNQHYIYYKQIYIICVNREKWKKLNTSTKEKDYIFTCISNTINRAQKSLYFRKILFIRKYCSLSDKKKRLFSSRPAINKVFITKIHFRVTFFLFWNLNKIENEFRFTLKCPNQVVYNAILSKPITGWYFLVPSLLILTY